MKTDLQPSLKWDIRTEPVLTSSKFDTGRKAIFRDDTNSLLSIVGKDYSPFTNHKLMELTDALIKTEEFVLKGFDEFNNGKTILAFLQNTNPNLKINNCKMKEYLILGNSHDGTRPFYVGTGSLLERCSNQFFSTLKLYSQKHTSPIEFSDFAIRELIDTYKIKKSNVYEAFDGMDSIRVDQEVVNLLVKEIHKMLVTDSSKIKQEDWGNSPSMMALKKSIEREMKDLGNNAFGLFNGVTWYTSHKMRNAGVDFGKITGTANIINQKAYRFCINLKRKNHENSN